MKAFILVNYEARAYPIYRALILTLITIALIKEVAIAPYVTPLHEIAEWSDIWGLSGWFSYF